MIATLTVKANNIIGFINPVIADTVRLIRPGFTVILNEDSVYKQKALFIHLMKVVYYIKYS